MNPPQQYAGDFSTGPRDTHLELVAEPDDTVLAHSLALYRHRLAQDSAPRCAFESSI